MVPACSQADELIVDWAARKDVATIDNFDDFIEQVRQFNILAGNTDDHFNGTQAALYLGLQCEELAEKLTRLGMVVIADELDKTATYLKSGAWIDPARLKVGLLDDDVDLLVVTIGSLLSMGVDIKGALQEVCRSNMSKVFADGTLHKDANGKIIKSPAYTPPNLTPFIC